MPDYGRLILHMGVPKTGSSALQVAFARNRAVLRELGVHYPTSTTDARALNGQVTSGNGTSLVPFLNGRGAGPAQDADVMAGLWREMEAAEGRDVLYSAEGLIGFQPDRLRALVSDLSRRGVAVHAAVFLRNRDGHAWSAYVQNVKRRGYRGSFIDFLGADDTPYKLSWQTQLQRLVAGVDSGSQVHLLNYEIHKSSLVGTFLNKVVGVAGSLERLDLDVPMVNRTLSRREVDWVRFTNGLSLAGRERRRLDDLLQERAPFAGNGFGLRAEEAEILNARFSSEIDWINNHPLYADEELRVISDPEAVRVEHDETLTDSERYLLECVATLLAEAPRRA